MSEGNLGEPVAVALVAAADIREHGGPGSITIERDFPDPKPGATDVVVRVRATTLNYHDVFTVRGMPGIKVPLPVIIGLDMAGEVAEVGAGVSGWRPGASAGIKLPPIMAALPRSGGSMRSSGSRAAR